MFCKTLPGHQVPIAGMRSLNCKQCVNTSEILSKATFLPAPASLDMLYSLNYTIDSTVM